MFLFFFYVLKTQAANSLMHIKGFNPGGEAYSLAKIHIKIQNPWIYIFFPNIS